QADLAQLFASTLSRAPNAAEAAGADLRLAQGISLQALQYDLVASGSAGGFAAVAAPSGDVSPTARRRPTPVVFGNLALGHDTITGFDPAQDAIVLSQTQLGSFSQLKAHAAATPDGTLITLSPTESILLTDVQLSSLHPVNF